VIAKYLSFSADTGEPLNRNRRSAVATNSIYHDPRHPSHIDLPVIPGVK